MGQCTEMKLSHQIKGWFLRGGENRVQYPDKNKEENQQTQPTYDEYDAESGNRTRRRVFSSPRHPCSLNRALIGYILCYRVFSRDFTAAMLVSLNKETAAMLVYPTYPLGIELYYHANVFFCFGGKTRLLITRVKILYSPPSNSREICAQEYCNRCRNKIRELKSSFCAMISYCFSMH